ncbi:MAG: disulfide oxidoreductase, partial [Proteobacteria bacterium]|nr:disulfide oxidoreductase [Pseudomonadota bacterium]
LGDAALSGPARGLAYQLIERLGSMPRRGAAREINALTPEDRAALSRLGVRIGRQGVYLPAMLKPASRAVRALLWAVHAGWRPVPPTPPGEALSMPLDSALPRSFYAAIGYRVIGRLALRLDAVERILARAGKLSRAGPFAPTAEMAALAGCDAASFGGVLGGLGYRAEAPDAQGVVFYGPPPRGRRAKRRRRRDGANPGSPFAKLASLRVAVP